MTALFIEAENPDSGVNEPRVLANEAVNPPDSWRPAESKVSTPTELNVDVVFKAPADSTDTRKTSAKARFEQANAIAPAATLSFHGLCLDCVPDCAARVDGRVSIFLEEVWDSIRGPMGSGREPRLGTWGQG